MGDWLRTDDRERQAGGDEWGVNSSTSFRERSAPEPFSIGWREQLQSQHESPRSTAAEQEGASRPIPKRPLNGEAPTAAESTSDDSGCTRKRSREKNEVIGQLAEVSRMVTDGSLDPDVFMTLKGVLKLATKAGSKFMESGTKLPASEHQQICPSRKVLTPGIERHLRKLCALPHDAKKRFWPFATVEADTNQGMVSSFAWSVLREPLCSNHCVYYFGNVDLSMRDSVGVAYHWVRCHREALLHRYGGLPEVDVERQGFGIEFPGVDAPVGGPSSGAMLAAGLVAMIAGKELSRRWIVMGTLRLNGDVGPVGGVKAKVAAISALKRDTGLEGVILAHHHVVATGDAIDKAKEVRWCNRGKIWKQYGRAFHVNKKGMLPVHACHNLWDVLDRMLLSEERGETSVTDKMNEEAPPTSSPQPVKIAFVKSIILVGNSNGSGCVVSVECCHSDVRQESTLTLTGNIQDATYKAADNALYFVRSEVLAVAAKKGGCGGESRDTEGPTYFVNMSPSHVEKGAASIGAAVAVALVSLSQNKPVDPCTLVAGEVCTEGEMVSLTDFSEDDVEELYRNDITRLFLPAGSVEQVRKLNNFDRTKLKVVGVENLKDALPHIFAAANV